MHDGSQTSASSGLAPYTFSAANRNREFLECIEPRRRGYARDEKPEVGLCSTASTIR